MEHIAMDHIDFTDVTENEVHRAFEDMCDVFLLIPAKPLELFLEENLDIIADASSVPAPTTALAFQGYIIDKCLHLFRNNDYDCGLDDFSIAEREIWYRMWERVFSPDGAEMFDKHGIVVDPHRKEQCLACNCRRHGWDYKGQMELFRNGSIDKDPSLWTNSVCPNLAQPELWEGKSPEIRAEILNGRD